MKTFIYYFSSTGNSLQIARIIASKIEDCTIKPVTKVITDEFVGGVGESIGFIFPVFNFGMPRLVLNFIKNLNILPETYCFAFICYGGYGANTLGMLEDLLAKKSIKLSYADGVEMPKSNASAPAGKKILKTISAAVVKVEKFSNDIINGVQRPVQRKAECLTKAANSRLYKNIEEFDKKFTVTSQCSSCGLCVQICPVNNIKRDNQQHIWLHKCERCLRCLQWCPNEAIQYGKRTINWKRYHNPDIKVKDILN